MRKPLAIDLFCGLGGWTEGFLSEGWDVVGFDIERHVYGEQRYPAQLVIQDVLTLDGRQFRNADCIVCSPPCQQYSYMAMPWSRAKQIAAALRQEVGFPEGYTGSRTVKDLRALFDACFRIQREACEAAGRHIPMAVENVKGAQPWVGKANASYGSFFFWGDVAMVGGKVVAGSLRFGDTVRAARRGQKRNPDGTDHPQGSWFAIADSKERGGRKGPGGDWFEGGRQGQDACAEALKVPGISLSGYGEPGYKPQGFNVTAAKRFREENGTKQHGSGPEWFDTGIAKHSSRSDSRKAASAQIAKIPFPLASYIARSFRPR
jgi:C-5 cytosine-specific DNA methylase